MNILSRLFFRSAIFSPLRHNLYTRVFALFNKKPAENRILYGFENLPCSGDKERAGKSKDFRNNGLLKRVKWKNCE